jgi:hypothetical protein
MGGVWDHSVEVRFGRSGFLLTALPSLSNGKGTEKGDILLFRASHGFKEKSHKPRMTDHEIRAVGRWL